MIHQIYKSQGARSSLNYIKKGDAELIAKNVLTENAREFEWIASKNHRAQYPFSHIILSAAPEDNIDSKQWREICKQYLQEMGYHDNQYIAYRHHDTANDHVHILANRIKITEPTATENRHNLKRGMQVLRQIESDFGLTPFEYSPRSQTGKIRNFNLKPERKQLRTLIEKAAEASVDQASFLEHLAASQITANIEEQGISYEADFLSEKTISSSKLGKKYNQKGLQHYFNLSLDCVVSDIKTKKASNKKQLEL